MIGATGRGDLGSDDVKRHQTALGAGGAFGHPGQPRGAQCGGLVIQRLGFALRAHRGVEMDLAEASGDIGRNHLFGLGHGLCLGQVAPGIGAKVIAAQDHQFRRAAFLRGQPEDQISEVLRRHAGITAKVVDLIAGRLDQHRLAVLSARTQSRAQDQGMG